MNSTADHDALVQHTQSLNIADGTEAPVSNKAAMHSDIFPNGGVAIPADAVDRDRNDSMGMDSALASDPSAMRNGTGNGEVANGVNDKRPTLRDEPSRSYIKPIPIVTTYEPALPPIERPKSVAASERERPKSIVPSERPKSVAAGSVKGRSSSRQGSIAPGSPNPATLGRLPPIADDAATAGTGLAIGEYATSERQRELQSGGVDHTGRGDGVTLVDSGPVPRMTSPRPRSAFGHRPLPVFVDDHGHQQGQQGQQPPQLPLRPESRFAESRGEREAVLGRSLSRAQTLGRNGTLSRGMNGGTIGSRRGGFGRGAGLSVGTQPEEVLGRDDIHARAEISERILDQATLQRLSTMERKDAKRMSKMIKTEAKSEAKAVAGSIKELERMARLAKEAQSEERKSQLRLSKWTANEHKARMRFLKEKERYEKVEGELRNAENDYEERRDHSAGLTAQLAEKTQELDDLRAQKAADDREREVKLLALKNPAHS